jgi:Protein of unknown function (DUF3309)
VQSYQKFRCRQLVNRPAEGRLMAIEQWFPTWPHSRNWGYYPSGGIAVILAIIVVLLLTGRA